MPEGKLSSIVSRAPSIPVVTPDQAGSCSGTTTALWQKSLAKVVPAIVVIRVCSCSAFDGDSPGYSHATGFVVDKARGIILTNRHVVTPGPTVTDAVFLNKEEVDLVPIYYDPVHDFGFLRFDPKTVKFLDVAEIELNPEGAKVGVEIRVVGNDSGEKLSILPGILARLDRAAPDYGSSSYRDFNTFYLAAASSTSGGSSGSPVLTIDGKAVALNCGARAESAAAFYLPLPKIARALELIQRGEKVSRGTIQTVLKHAAFDEARRLGLDSDTEASIRKAFPEETGVLVVNQVIPKGPADDILEPGDVVIYVNGELVTTFLPCESYFDSSVGGEVEVHVQRGGREIIAKIKVGDLHEITPSEYLDVSSGVLHPLSYQQARNYNLPVEGVYLAQAGYMLERAWVVSQCLITSVGSEPIPNLDACEAALSKIPDGARVALRYKALADRHRTKTAVITMDRKWFSMQRVRRSEVDGLWHATPSRPPPPSPSSTAPAYKTPGSLAAKAAALNGAPRTESRAAIPAACGDVAGSRKESRLGGSGAEGEPPQELPPLTNAAGVAASISSSLVMVSFDIPHLVDGVSGSYCIGVGVIVDKELGLVVVDRTTVQVALGDVMLTFNGSEEVAACPIFVHPVQNFSVVRFDPSTVKGSFEAAVLASRETEDSETQDCELPGPRPPSLPAPPPPKSESEWVSGAERNALRKTGGEVGNPGEIRESGNVHDVNSPSNGSEIPRPSSSVEVFSANSRFDGNCKGMPSTDHIDRPGREDRKADELINASSTGFANADAVCPSRGDAPYLRDLSPPPLHPGDKAEFHGLTSANAPVRQRTVAVKLERLSLISSAHPQFTAHSVEVLQFERIASCLGGVLIALPREGDCDSLLPPPTLPPPLPPPQHQHHRKHSDLPSAQSQRFPTSVSCCPCGSSTISSTSSSSASSSPSSPTSSPANQWLYRPIVSAFWHSFSFSDAEGRKNTMRGLPAPVVRRSVDRIRRDLKRLEANQKTAPVEDMETTKGRQDKGAIEQQEGREGRRDTLTDGEAKTEAASEAGTEAGVVEARDQSEDDSGDIVGDNGDEGCVSGVVSYGTYRGDHVGGPNDEDRGEGGEAAQRPGDNGHKDGSMGTSMRPTATSKGIIGGVDEAAVSAARVLDMVETAGSEGLLQSRRPEEISGPEDESHADVRDVERATTDRVEGQRVDGHARCGGFKMNQSREIPAEEATAGDAKVNSKVPDTRMGIGLDGAERSLGAAPCLPLQLITVELSKARAGLGLSEEWSRRVEKKCGERQKQVLEVRRCMAGTPAFAVMETGDIILAVEEKLVTRFRVLSEMHASSLVIYLDFVNSTSEIEQEVEVAVEALEGKPVRLTVLRQLEEVEVTVIPSYLPTRETDRFFMWAGLMIQTPHLAVLQLGFLPKEGGGVYSSRWCYGSPAHKYSLGCTTWIVEVNGIPTPTLDAFLDAVKDIGDKAPARIKTVGLDSKVEVTTFRTDHHYWPTLELRRSENGCWTRKLHTGPRASVKDSEAVSPGDAREKCRSEHAGSTSAGGRTSALNASGHAAVDSQSNTLGEDGVDLERFGCQKEVRTQETSVHVGRGGSSDCARQREDVEDGSAQGEGSG